MFLLKTRNEVGNIFTHEKYLEKREQNLVRFKRWIQKNKNKIYRTQKTSIRIQQVRNQYLRRAPKDHLKNIDFAMKI